MFFLNHKNNFSHVHNGPDVRITGWWHHSHLWHEELHTREKLISVARLVSCELTEELVRHQTPHCSTQRHQLLAVACWSKNNHQEPSWFLDLTEVLKIHGLTQTYKGHQSLVEEVTGCHLYITSFSIFWNFLLKQVVFSVLEIFILDWHFPVQILQLFRASLQTYFGLCQF